MRPYLLYIADTCINDGSPITSAECHHAHTFSCILRSKKSGNCILYLAIEYFSVSRSLRAEGLQTALYSLACVKMSKILWLRTNVRAGVENIGLEPMTSCMPCKRSSQLS